jgi:hypothetical protein
VFAIARRQISDTNFFQPYLKRLRVRFPLPDIATRNTSPDTPVTAAATSAAPGHRSWKGKQPEESAAIREAVSSMAAGNEKFRNWLAANNIEAVPNRGRGLNCLIISLLQHATGAYGSEYERGFADKAQQYRHTLGIDPGMLYSDERSVSAIVDAINREFEIDLGLVEVQSNELGLPFIATPLDSLPKQANKVVVWQQGDHFEALYARTTIPAS